MELADPSCSAFQDLGGKFPRRSYRHHESDDNSSFAGFPVAVGPAHKADKAAHDFHFATCEKQFLHDDGFRQNGFIFKENPTHVQYCHVPPQTPASAAILTIRSVTSIHTKFSGREHCVFLGQHSKNDSNSINTASPPEADEGRLLPPAFPSRPSLNSQTQEPSTNGEPSSAAASQGQAARAGTGSETLASHEGNTQGEGAGSGLSPTLSLRRTNA